MKKNLAILLGCATLIILLLTACGTTTIQYTQNTNNVWNQFVLVEKQKSIIDWGTLYIVYDKDTKVMYYMWDGSYTGGFTPIYNADGSVKVYDN